MFHKAIFRAGEMAQWVEHLLVSMRVRVCISCFHKNKADIWCPTCVFSTEEVETEISRGSWLATLTESSSLGFR